VKNEKIIESVEKIMPDEAQKDRLLRQAYDRSVSGEIQARKISPAKIAIRWLAPVAACLVIALAAVSIPNLFNSNPGILPPAPNSQTEQSGNTPEGTSPNGEGEMREIPPWDDMHITNQFGGIKVNGIEYTANSQIKIDPSKIGGLIGRTSSTGYDICETGENDDKRGKEHTINCELYAIKGMSSEFAVAVKYEGYDGYYPFINWMHKPETLGDLIDGVNLTENLVFNSVYYSYWKDGIIADGNYITMIYTLSDYSVIWDMLLSDTSVKNAGDGFYGLSVMDISIDVKVLGDVNISLTVTDEGYLKTNILSTQKAFFIGKDKVQAFVDYVLETGTGTLFEPEVEIDATDILE